MTGVELAKLEAKGHAIKHIEVRPGSTKLILVDPDTGVRMGASDPRTDGHAAAL
jgi:gamma-glutamyltranspeptidase